MSIDWLKALPQIENLAAYAAQRQVARSEALRLAQRAFLRMGCQQRGIPVGAFCLLSDQGYARACPAEFDALMRRLNAAEAEEDATREREVQAVRAQYQTGEESCPASPKPHRSKPRRL